MMLMIFWWFFYLLYFEQIFYTDLQFQLLQN